ncbi:PP2C family serine/threonine-protein phosphatase [Thermoflavimicrobium dichotomicum]|uniref:Protein phosphatase 2C n=1 Tax=Thermoflavimicrobium dichotomicum TaxID=46223 RepID=A0A1I3RC53_9BACL|nr:PP2C family serine/threonine-protein phosphatase [Thermoflavimicrobium dichotomicum]SFJ42907.1 Protein phosphatase 2C [Thermoflavimicrobium dichotomicum]
MISEWKAVSAHVMGRSHMKKQLPCQDHTFHITQNDVTAIVLADGAGSCPRSHEGAEIATTHCAYLLTHSFTDMIEKGDRELAQMILSEIKNQFPIDENEKDPVESMKQFASTLLFVAVRDDTYLAGHLGDGLIAYQEGEECKILSYPQNHEFINTTFFTTSLDALEHFQFYRGSVQQIHGFMLMSDGSAESLYSRKDQSLATAVNKMMGWLEKYPTDVVQEALMQNLKSMLREKTMDDCSLAMMKKLRTNEEIV